jgi:hypothetical protein
MQYRAFWKDNGEDYQDIANLQTPVEFQVDWANHTVKVAQTPLSIGSANGTFSFGGTFGSSLFEDSLGLCPVPSFGTVPRGVATACSSDGSLVFTAPDLASGCRNVETIVLGKIVAVNDVTLSSPIPIVNGSAQAPRGKLLVRWTANDARGKSATVDQIVDAVSRPALAAVGAMNLGDRTSAKETSGQMAVVSNTGAGGVMLGTDVALGEIDSVGLVVLRDRDVISGAIISPVVPNASQTAKFGSYIAQTPSAISPPSLPSPSGATLSVTVAVGQSVPLNPGAFGAVTVYSNGKLSLVSGDYAFDSLDLEPNAHLALDKSAGPIRIVVNKNLILRGTYDHTPNTATGFVLGYLGSSPLSVESPFRGTLVAPNATVDLQSLNGLKYEGEFFAASLRTEAGATVVHVPMSCSN